MRTLIRTTATLQLALILPAALFLTAVLVETGSNPQYGLARGAQWLVMWYSGRMWTLGLLLFALPLAVLVTGCATLLRSWNYYDAEPPHPAQHSLATIPAPLATLFVAGMTLMSASILAVVVLHIGAN